MAVYETLKPQNLVGICGTPGQGNHMILVLKVLDGLVVQARYSTYGCVVAKACGQWLCDELEGKSLSYASTIDEKQLIDGTGEMPLGREHCPRLAIEALRNAIEQIEK
jgi:nitrogen fixation NifU-like protein